MSLPLICIHHRQDPGEVEKLLLFLFIYIPPLQTHHANNWLEENVRDLHLGTQTNNPGQRTHWVCRKRKRRRRRERIILTFDNNYFPFSDLREVLLRENSFFCQMTTLTLTITTNGGGVAQLQVSSSEMVGWFYLLSDDVISRFKYSYVMSLFFAGPNTMFPRWSRRTCGWT